MCSFLRAHFTSSFVAVSAWTGSYTFDYQGWNESLQKQDFSPFLHFGKPVGALFAKLQISSCNVVPDIYVHKNHHAYLQRIHLQTSLQARTSQLLCYYWKDWNMIYISFGGTTPTENKRLLFSESTRVRMDKRLRKLLCCTTRLCKEWSLDVSDTKNKYVSREVLCLCVSIYHSQYLHPITIGAALVLHNLYRS